MSLSDNKPAKSWNRNLGLWRVVSGVPYFSNVSKTSNFSSPVISVHLPAVEGGRYFHGRFQGMIEELIPWVMYIGLPKLNNTHVPCHLRPLPSYQGALASTTATAAKKSLLKWIRVFSNFVAFIPIHWNCEMWANFLGVDFLGTGLKLRKRKENSASLVYVLHKSWN